MLYWEKKRLLYETIADCITCKHCLEWKRRNHRVIEVNCEMNTNLGAVSTRYKGRCKDYESNLHDDNAAPQS